MDSSAYYIVVLAIAAGLGLIPANIAKKKGYSFGLWWFYGWMLFIVAIIHVSLIPDKTATAVPASPVVTTSNTSPNSLSVAEEIKKYKDLRDQNIITEEEFQIKKEQLLKLI